MSTQPSIDKHIFDILVERGFVQQSTDESALREALNKPLTFYIGFDPTADCLHVGHLVPIMLMSWLQKAGHRPIIVLGGGTAMIGDPSGKDKTREILTPEKIQHNLRAQKELFRRFVDLDQAIVVDNGEWLLELNYVDFLRDIGKHFSVNRMIASSGAQQRLERGQGYSFIEFNYHLCQSYDYLVLNQQHGCTLQCGGDDQWFNILGGVDLVRREQGEAVHALTLPLVVTSDGKKMGKTEKGAVWIEASRVSPYDYYQYWVNVPDADVVKMMKLYTYMPLVEVERYAALTGADIRQAKAALAFEATKLAHGEIEAKKAQEAAKDAFSGAATANMPKVELALPCSLVSVLKEATFAQSNGAARRLIQGGGVRIGDQKVTDIGATVDEECVVWAGKKRCVRVVSSR